MHVFDKLNFDRAILADQLAFVKKRYEEDDATDSVKAWEKQVSDLQQAADKMEEALENLTQRSAAIICDLDGGREALLRFSDGVRRMNTRVEIPFNVYAEKAMRSGSRQITGAVLQLAKIYRDHTGKPCTVSVNVAGNKKSGLWLEFLDACAPIIKAPSHKLRNRAQKLREAGRI